MISNQIVEIDYVNWRGERSIRRILPVTIQFASSKWRSKPQWLLSAEDLSKRETRDFAMKDIQSRRPVSQ